MIRGMQLRPAFMLIGVVSLAVATAMGGSSPIGSLVGSRNATLNGQNPLPHTTVLDGDTLQVNNGVAVVSLNHGNRMILGRETQTSFSRKADTVTVSLARGNMMLYHSGKGMGFRVKAGDVIVSPTGSHQAMGEVAMADGLLLVTSKDGTLKVEKSGTTEEVTQGKTITIAAQTAGAPGPIPQKSRHNKKILHVSRKALVGLGIAAVAGSTAAAIVLESSTPEEVSPSTP